MPRKADLASVYAAPDDDRVRAAYAQAVGGPHGELISLQLAADRTKAQRAREQQLVKQLRKALTAPLGDVVVQSSVSFERGFPASARLNLGARWLKQTKGAKHPLASMASLATLRRLKLGSPNTNLTVERATELVLLRPLRGLRVIEDLPRAALPKMLRARPPFAVEVIDVKSEGGGGLEGERQEARARAALDAAFAKGALPNLVELTLSWNHGAGLPADYAWLFESAQQRQLQRLSFAVYYFARALIAWRKALLADKKLALQTLQITWGSCHDLTLHREDGRWSRITGSVSTKMSERELQEALDAWKDRSMAVDVKGFRRRK